MVNKMQIIFNPIQAQAFRYDYFMKRKQQKVKENKFREIYNYNSDNNIQKKKFETQPEIFLDQGRKKLSEHLNQEEAMYHQELINN